MNAHTNAKPRNVIGHLCKQFKSGSKTNTNSLTFSLRHIITARTSFGHTIIRVLLLLFSVGLLIYLVFPLLFWFMFGEGASADRISQKSVSILLADFLPFVIGIAICSYQLIRKAKLGDLSKAKSYFIAGLTLLVVYPFREPIINAVIETCLFISDRL